MNLKIGISFLLFFMFALLLFLVGVQIGSFKLDPTTIMTAILEYDSTNIEHFAVVELRLPRLLLAFLVGGALALCGYLMQAMVNNPLADPYFLGTSSGASLGASIAYAGIVPSTLVTVSLFSFSGALIVTFCAIALSYQRGRIEPTRLMLSGVALSALMVSITSLIMFTSSDDSRLKNIIFWTLGGFDMAAWNQVPFILLVLVVLTLVFTFYQKQLTILLLGEERAENIGINTKSLRWVVLLSCSIATGLSVSIAGPIGFVGLIIPHVIRSIYGVNGRFNIMLAVLLGGVFLLACEVSSRLIFPPSGIPLGIVTSIIGIPFFVYLLLKKGIRF